MSTAQAQRRDSCPVCASRDLRALAGYERAHLARCRSCGMTFSNRLPTESELTAHYADYGHAWNDSPITRARYQELLESFEPYRQTSRLLDVGCGAGFFLEEARDRGWQVHGNEFSAHAIEVNRAKGLDVIHGPITLDTFEPGRFDVITAFEVFEHVADPTDQGLLLARILRPGGLLYCTTPNFNALSRRILKARWNVIDYPEHLCYYTPATIRSWLGGAGFAPESVTSTGIDISRLREGLSAPAGEAAPHESTDEELRTTIEGSSMLRLGKTAANRTLSAFGAGDTLKARFRRRALPQ
jgi:2-polyprenyl-3-methyl-5-hydroxy-6-metoxy-1,4-benzoquinol methylase